MKKFWVLGSSVTSKVIINIQTGILWFTECFHQHCLSQQLCDVGRRESLWVQRNPALSSGSCRKSATDSCACAPMCMGSMAASEQTARVWWAGSRPGSQNLTVPFFVLEKDHPRKGPESQSSKGRWQWLEKAKEVGLASQGARYDINFLHVWWD